MSNAAGLSAVTPFKPTTRYADAPGQTRLRQTPEVTPQPVLPDRWEATTRPNPAQGRADAQQIAQQFGAGKLQALGQPFSAVDPKSIRFDGKNVAIAFDHAKLDKKYESGELLNAAMKGLPAALAKLGVRAKTPLTWELTEAPQARADAAALSKLFEGGKLTGQKAPLDAIDPKSIKQVGNHVSIGFDVNKLDAKYKSSPELLGAALKNLGPALERAGYRGKSELNWALAGSPPPPVPPKRPHDPTKNYSNRIHIEHELASEAAYIEKDRASLQTYQRELEGAKQELEFLAGEAQRVMKTSTSESAIHAAGYKAYQASQRVEGLEKNVHEVEQRLERNVPELEQHKADFAASKGFWFVEGSYRSWDDNPNP